MDNGWEFYRRYWLPAERTLADVEAAGVGFDREACDREAALLRDSAGGLKVALAGLAGRAVNWRSPLQVAEYLYDVLKCKTPPVKGGLNAVQITKPGERPTSEAALHSLADSETDPKVRELLGALILLRNEYKLLGFFETLPSYAGRGARIHPGLAPSTETGRLSCRNPNLQQQPPSTRHCFVAGPGNALVCLDYSGLEWRILAHILSFRYGDESLVQEIRDGVDPHSATAQRMFPECCMVPVGAIKADFPNLRAQAKTLNYAINYGKSAAGLGVQLRNEDGTRIGVKAAKLLLERFYEINPGIEKWHAFIKRFAREKGYVRSLLGRYRFLDFAPGLPKWVHSKAERLAMNTPIQGSAADIVNLAMVKCHTSPQLRRLGCKVILQVHDELLFECPEQNAEQAKEWAADIMRGAMIGEKRFDCPLEVEGGIGYSWKEAGGK